MRRAFVFLSLILLLTVSISRAEEDSEESDDDDESESVDLSEVNPASALHKLVSISDEGDFPVRELLLHMIHSFEEEFAIEPPLPARYSGFNDMKYSEVYHDSLDDLQKTTYFSSEVVNKLRNLMSFLPGSVGFNEALSFSNHAGNPIAQIYLKQEQDAKALSGEDLSLDNLVTGPNWVFLRELGAKWASPSQVFSILVSSLNLHFPIHDNSTIDEHSSPVPNSVTVGLRPYASFFFRRSLFAEFASEAVQDEAAALSFIKKLATRLLPREFPDASIDTLANFIKADVHAVSLTEITSAISVSDQRLKVTYDIGDGLVNASTEAEAFNNLLQAVSYGGNIAALVATFSEYREVASLVTFSFFINGEGNLEKNGAFQFFFGEYLSHRSPVARVELLRERVNQLGGKLVKNGHLTAEQVSEAAQWLKAGKTNHNVARFQLDFDGEKFGPGSIAYLLDAKQ